MTTSTAIAHVDHHDHDGRAVGPSPAPPPSGHPGGAVVAVVAYPGVLADETAAFVDVLGRLPGARLVTVGSAPGVVAGPGGIQTVDVTFDELAAADVVVVPGGLGCRRHPEVAAWIASIRPRWVLASSTGSAVLGAGGLLRGRSVATHWLARALLEADGAIVWSERVVVDEPYVTCTGLVTAFDAAEVVVAALGGDELVGQVRAARAAAATGQGSSTSGGACPARARRRRRVRPRPR